MIVLSYTCCRDGVMEMFIPEVDHGCKNKAAIEQVEMNDPRENFSGR